MQASLSTRACTRRRAQRGGFFLGVVVGVLAGLALALGVALYVTKVPVPFVNKVPQGAAGDSAAELERNKSWDPNSALAGSTSAGPASGAGVVGTPVAPLTELLQRPPPAAGHEQMGTRNPSAILSGQQVTNDPGAESTNPVADPFTYFIQTGAYVRSDDAEQQRVRMAMLGYEAKITEREQAGRTIYRVRVGPYDNKEQADTAKNWLEGAGVESALVRVQR